MVRTRAGGKDFLGTNYRGGAALSMSWMDHRPHSRAPMTMLLGGMATSPVPTAIPLPLRESVGYIPSWDLFVSKAFSVSSDTNPRPVL